MKKLFAMAMVAALAGCGVGAVDSADETGASSDDLRSSLPKVGTAEPRIYWNAGGPLDFGGASRGPFYRSFDAQGGTAFTVSVTNYDDGGEPDTVPFHIKLYYASGSRWRLYGTADSASSTATITANPRYAHSWLLVMRADADFYVLQSYLSCSAKDRSQCAVELQPNDACDLSTGGCDVGLYCDNGADTNSACGQAGQCRSVDAVCGMKQVGTVCGCDGTDYASACDAATASVGIAFNDSCANPPPTGCDPDTSWAPGDIGLGGIEKTGTWANSDGSIVYQFDGSGTVAITDSTGSYSGTFAVDANNAQQLDVTLDSGAVHFFSELSNCAGDLMLSANWKGSGGFKLLPNGSGPTPPPTK